MDHLTKWWLCVCVSHNETGRLLDGGLVCVGPSVLCFKGSYHILKDVWVNKKRATNSISVKQWVKSASKQNIKMNMTVFFL